MDTSIFLARFFGLYLIVMGFFCLFRRDYMRRAAEQIFEQESLIIITALINLIIGLLVVLVHNRWEFNWRVTITIIGYLAIIKALARFFLPKKADKMLVVRFARGDNPIYIGIICLILGFFLTYEGFNEIILSQTW